MIHITDSRVEMLYQEGMKEISRAAQKARNLDIYIDGLKDFAFSGFNQMIQSLEARLNQIDPDRVSKDLYKSSITGTIQRLFEQLKRLILVKINPKEIKSLKKMQEEVERASEALSSYKDKMVIVIEKEQDDLLQVDDLPSSDLQKSQPRGYIEAAASYVAPWTNGLFSSATNLLSSSISYAGSFLESGKNSSAVEQKKPSLQKDPTPVQEKNQDPFNEKKIGLKIIKQMFKSVVFNGLEYDGKELSKLQEKIFDYIFALDQIDKISYLEDGSFLLEYKQETEVDFSTWYLKITAVLPKKVTLFFNGSQIKFVGENLPIVKTRFIQYAFDTLGFFKGNKGNDQMLVKGNEFSIPIDGRQIIEKLKSVFGKEAINQILNS